MKPIKLEMTAFGSFKNHTVIDFSNFEKEVFLITGDTGAGKTTIFDAITYGLFGTLSGSGSKSRTPEMMHTKQLSKSIDTVVELTFAHNGETYKVVRTMHYAKKQKLENQYDDKASLKAVLYDSEGQACCSGAKYVTDEIERILGIKVEQFLKIVMLAQGEFKAFLTSAGDKKAEIIGTLFDSSKYEYYEKIFKLAYDKLADERKESEGRIKLVLDSTFNKPDTDRYSEELWLWRGEDDKLIGNLTALLDDEQAEYDEVSRKANELAKRRDDLLLERKNAEINNNNLKELAECQKALEALEARKGEIAQKRLEREQIWKAWYDIHGLVNQLENIQNRLNYEIEEKSNLEKRLSEVTQELTQLSEEAAQDEAILSQKESLGIEIDSLRKSVLKFESRDAERKNLQTLQKRSDDILSKISTYKDERNKTESLLEKCKEQLRHLSGADAVLIEKNQLVEYREKQLEDIRSLIGYRNSLLATEKKREEAAAICAESSENCSKLDAEFYDLQTRFYSGQAGLLGEKLLEDIRKNGSGICPVCRSKIQGDVSKIVTRGEDVPVEDDVKAAEERSRKAKAEFDKKHSEFERYKAQSEEKRAELVKNLQKLLGDSVADQALADGYLENQAEAEEAQKQQAIAERKQAEENVKEKEKQEKNKERFEEQLHKFDENINIENENLAAVNKDIAASSEKIKGIEEQLKGESAEEVEKEIKSKEEKCKAIEKILSDHKIRKEKLDKDKNVITGSLVKINEDIPKDQANKKSISEELENKLAEDEFDKVEDAERLIQDIADVATWIKHRDEEIKKYDMDVKSTSDIIASLEPKTQGCEYIELSAIDTRLDETKTEIETVKASLTSVDKLIDNHRSVLDTISTESMKLQSSRQAVTMLRSLSEKANGVSTDGGKLSFSRYIMSSVFAEIVQHANVWLDIMTGGRYELVHVMETSRNSSIAGFELEIRDVLLGTQREAASLSGGESFLASMSLALGLSDVVRNEAGGMDMEALFIDEGFGTLDEEVLTKVEEVLKTLKSNGNMVGIITHIGRLEMITDKIIEVHYDVETGSAVKVK